MKNELNSLLILIRDICENGKADLYQSDWLKIGLDDRETERQLQKLQEKGVILSIESTFSSGKFKSAGEAEFVRPVMGDYVLPAFKLSIDKRRLEELLGESESTSIDKKYSDANEDILLKTLGIKIKGNYISRGNEKIVINSTDKALIYFLYFKSIKNADECFSLKDLSKTKGVEKSERYIKNRIALINQSIRKIISKTLRLKIGRFVKNERKRGYRLNPKILLKKSRS